MVSPQARREQVAFACERGLSERRACGLLGIAHSTLGYELRLPAKDRPVIEAMRQLSSHYPRYGYRRIRIFLKRQGHQLGWHRAHRLWSQAGLQLPRRRPRRRIASGRPRPLPAVGANFIWAYNFVFDSCANGQQLKCLTIIDEFTRECLAIDVAGSIRSKRLIEVLTRLVSQHGAPLFLLSDNGPEFVSLAVLEWLAHRSRQALAERQRRELQRQAPRRVPERRVVPLAGRRQGSERLSSQARSFGVWPRTRHQH